MFDDGIIPGFEAAKIGAHARSESARPSPLEEEVVAIFDQMREPLLRYLLSLGLAPDDGEEIAQDVFLALFRHLQRGKPRQNVRAWVFQVGHNLAMKQRHLARRTQQGLQEYGDVLTDRVPNPEDLLAGKQKQDRLRAAVRALAGPDRRCLFLRAEGLTYREIAQVLDMSLGAVSLSLSRTLARLARAGAR